MVMVGRGCVIVLVRRGSVIFGRGPAVVLVGRGCVIVLERRDSVLFCEGIGVAEVCDGWETVCHGVDGERVCDSRERVCDADGVGLESVCCDWVSQQVRFATYDLSAPVHKKFLRYTIR